MTVKGWMVFLGAVIFAMILANCARDNNRDEGPKAPPSKIMTCSEQMDFTSSGVVYVADGDRLAAVNGRNQRHVLTQQETQAGYMFDRCSNARGFQGNMPWNGQEHWRRSENPGGPVPYRRARGPRDGRPGGPGGPGGPAEQECVEEFVGGNYCPPPPTPKK